ncbi:hypothetical protein O2K51_04980 [Apibacter raozihei]|uniref:hypothetical protein n=1 Tax=Apibacter TaxID=1778601 RepID=UPI000FE2EA4F|nr:MULTISPECIES: hypothetical protein [Apibacter]
MNKNKLANIIAFLIGLYFIVRAYFWYKNSNGEDEKNIYMAVLYLLIGIVAFSAQIFVNTRKKKKDK